MSLHWVARWKDPDDVTMLLDSGASIDSQDERGMTPLMVAIRYGRTENYQTLLARGANVQMRNWNSFLPLHQSCRQNDTIAARLLLRHGADIEAVCRDGGTALSLAAMLGNEEFVKFLLRNGANVEAQLVDGMTPLHCACDSGYEVIVTVLIAYGANVEAVDDCGRTLLWHATRQGRLQVVRILLKATTSNINAQVYNSPTALSTAVRHGYNAIVQILLKAGAEILPEEPGPHVPFLDPSKRLKDYGWDAVVEAMGQESQRVTRTILKAGARTDPGEYARWLSVWEHGEDEDTKPLTVWVATRRNRRSTHKIEAMRKAMIKKVREIDLDKRRKVAEEIGVPFIDPDFSQFGARFKVNLDTDSEDEIDFESDDE